MSIERDDVSLTLRKLPQVEKLAAALPEEISHALRVSAARETIERVRSAIKAGDSIPELPELVLLAQDEIHRQERARLVPIINATGVLLHTNLGRAPLAEAALEAIASLGRTYSNLEYDLEEGRRGSRYAHTANLLTELTGAPSALVVNNNAAAVMLTLSAIAPGKEVVISRGELIEIGGEFRIPDILQTSGARLVEVGTTNRTHLADYEKAIGPETGAIMKVHPSNYRVVGFATQVRADVLADLAHSRNLPLIHDLGSGLIRRRIASFEPLWLHDEPSVQQALDEDADVVTFSGDKLLGGPQAGIILGRADLMDQLRKHPLLRTFRVDKTTIAALEATLLLYLSGNELEIPFWKMALAEAEEILERSHRVAEALQDARCKVEVTDGFSTTGGGAGAGTEIPTSLIEIAPRERSPDEVTKALLDFSPPVVARIDRDRVIVDLRTVEPHNDAVLKDALLTAL